MKAKKYNTTFDDDDLALVLLNRNGVTIRVGHSSCDGEKHANLTLEELKRLVTYIEEIIDEV